MEIKICGIRRKEDIDIINKYKPDYIGFIFAKSKREVTPETVAEITKNLDKNIKKVGVFVNATYEKINEAVLRDLWLLQKIHTYTQDWVKKYRKKN